MMITSARKAFLQQTSLQESFGLKPFSYADARGVRERVGVGVRGGAQGRRAVPGSGGLRVGARDVRTRNPQP